MNMERWKTNIKSGNWRSWKKTCPNITSSITIPAWTGLGLDLVLRGKRGKI